MTPAAVWVRPVQDADWEKAAHLWTATQPNDPLSGPELRRLHEQQSAWGHRHLTLVAGQEGGTVLGLGLLTQNPGMYHPQRFMLELAVDPSHQGQGIGSALWEVLAAQLRDWNALSVRTLAREDHSIAPGFLSRRGFLPGHRYFTSALDVAAFDPAPFAATLERVRAAGVRIRNLAELQAAQTPDLPTRLHALMSEVRQDVPRSEPATPLSFEVFEEGILNDPGLLPDAYLVAEGPRGQWLGQTALFRSEASADLLTGLTGVTREARGQGVATALKLRAVEVARALGAPRIHTDNASDNAPMLAINDRFGFVRNPASVSWVLQFGTDGSR